METKLFPTKGNLIIAKNTLALSRQGYDILDRKRNILIREMMEMINRAEAIQAEIDNVFDQAYHALQIANFTLGINSVSLISYAVPIEESIDIRFRSVMGVDIPMVFMDKKDAMPSYGFAQTNSALDETILQFDKVKKLIIELTEIENSVYRLATNIKKTQKRANALKNIVIPKYEAITEFIINALEEKDREEFTRLKVIKHQKK